MYESILYDKMNCEVMRTRHIKKEYAIESTKRKSLYAPKDWYAIARDENYQLLAWFEKGVRKDPF